MFYDKAWIQIACGPCSAAGLQVAIQPQSRVGVSFSGNSVSWIAARGPFAGIAAVVLDGALVAQVDLYAPALAWQTNVFARQGLGPGEHTIVVEVTGAKNPAATAAAVLIDAFDVGY